MPQQSVLFGLRSVDDRVVGVAIRSKRADPSPQTQAATEKKAR